MSALYSVWDIFDDLVSRKVNESDASKFAEICRCALLSHIDYVGVL